MSVAMKAELRAVHISWQAYALHVPALFVGHFHFFFEEKKIISTKFTIPLFTNVNQKCTLVWSSMQAVGSKTRLELTR